MNILYPSLCIHCKTNTRQLVCDSCAHFFEFLPKKGRLTACFDEIESVVSFINQLRQSERCQKAAISFLIVQFDRMGWPTPDLVTSVPRRHFRSSNISAILAKGFAKKMGLPYKSLAKRPFGDLPHEEEPTFTLTKKVEAQHILIIDDYRNRGKTMESLARTLRLGLQAQIYGLAVTQR